MAKVVTINGKRAKPAQVIKWWKGVYIVTPNDPKVTDPNIPFRVRVGKAEGKEGIFGRIASHQSSNFDRLYYLMLHKFTFPGVFEKYKTPVKVEQHLHQILTNTEKVLHRDSWYEFTNLHHFLTFMELNFHVAPMIMEQELEKLGNFSELLKEYKYTETQVSFNLFYDYKGRKYPSSFQWFCSTPVEKAPNRGLVFKNDLIYEEYFDTDAVDKYKDIVGGYYYIKNTQLLFNSKHRKIKEWEHIVIIGKEQDNITEDTHFMQLPPGKYYKNQATPPGDTLIVIGDDPEGNACSLKHNMNFYNLFLDFPCFSITMTDNVTSPTPSKVSFRYRPYDENPIEQEEFDMRKALMELEELEENYV